MCDMREVGIDEGIEIGISKGIEIGIAREKIRSKIEFVQTLLDSKFSFTQALEMAKIDEETYNTYKDIYGKNNLS